MLALYWVTVGFGARRSHNDSVGLRTVPIHSAAWLREDGTIRRVVVSMANAAVDQARRKNPKTKCNTGRFQKQFRSARGGRERLQALIFARYPNVLDLQNCKDASCVTDRGASFSFVIGAKSATNLSVLSSGKCGQDYSLASKLRSNEVRTE